MLHLQRIDPSARDQDLRNFLGGFDFRGDMATRAVEPFSGGEKSLAAIALIFAILLYRPSPFLILDEVDAALDDANTNLFNRLIRDVAEKSQVIMITHNKSTMEVADTLFGVTMQKQGISSLVSVTLN